MVIEELLDDDAFDPKKLFNEEEYSTLFLDRDGFSKKENANADIIEALLNKKNTRAEKEALFAQLKELGAQDLLVSAIKSTQNVGLKVKLLEACWESGLDFSKYFLLFVEYACHSNFDIAFEALTVVENEEGTVEQSVLQQAILTAQNCKSNYNVLIEELIESIKSRLS